MKYIYIKMIKQREGINFYMRSWKIMKKAGALIDFVAMRLI